MSLVQLIVLLASVALLSRVASGANQMLNIMVPAYFDPSVNAQAWSSLNSAATSLPNRLVAVANPNSGPDTASQPSYTSAISALQTKSGKVIGYVYTTYGNRSEDTVKTDVDKWYNFYPNINGIFFDEAANTDGKQAYYQDLYNYVKKKNASSIVVNNPGTSTLESYLFYNGTRVADIICVYETNTSATTWTTATWTTKYDRSNFYAIPYNVPNVDVSSYDYGDAIDHAYQQNIGWVYVSDQNGGNPYGSLASYFPQEVDYIAQSNYLESSFMFEELLKILGS